MAVIKVLQQYKRQTQDPKGPNSKENKVRILPLWRREQRDASPRIDFSWKI